MKGLVCLIEHKLYKSKTCHGKSHPGRENQYTAA